MPGRRLTAAPLRVLHVVDSLDAGGAERHVVDLAAEQVRRGHHVEVACSVGGMLASELEQRRVPFTALLPELVKRRVSPEFAIRLRHLIRARNFDVVHAHMYASAVASADATDCGPALVLTEHTEAPWRSAAAIRTSKRVYRRADMVLAVSTAISEALCNRYGVPRSRVRIVPPAIIPAAGPPAVRPPAWQDRPVIGQVCRLQPEKGVDVFLRAAALARTQIPHAWFVVIGDGPLRGELEALGDELELGECVQWLGFRPDARALIGTLDVLAVSSHSEGMPLVIFEAFGAGVPIVASAVGGIPDQVRDGREGLLVPPGDPIALAGALVRVVGDPELSARLRCAALRRAAQFPHSAMVDAVESAYLQALTCSPSKGLGRVRLRDES